MANLTSRQRAIFEFIVARVQGEGIPPTLMEIASAFGLSSAAGVADHLKAIERKGYIRRRPGASRGIEVASSSPRGTARRAVRVPIVGQVPSWRGLQHAGDRHVMVDGRLLSGEAVALRAAARGLERRGILEGDLLILERSAARAGQLFVARQGDAVLLLELADDGTTARVLAGRRDRARDLEFQGRLAAVVRSFEPWTT